MLHHKINGCRLNARLACTSNLLKLIRKANDMKNIYVKIISLVLIAVSTAAFSGCGENKESSASQTQTTAAQATQTATQESASAVTTKTDKNMPFPKYAENGDDFTGAWKITKGTGSKLKSFTFSFDGEGKSALIVDNAGYFGEYELKEKDGSKVFVTQLYFGLNGEYTYKISSDKSEIVLTNTEDKSTTTLTKLESIGCIPKAKESKIDKNLLGAWKSEDGEYFYFDNNGIMYHNQYNTMFNYATYSAENSKINAVYNMQEEMKEDYEYSVHGDNLKLNGYDYKKISESELE